MLTISWDALSLRQSGDLPVLNDLIKSDNSDFKLGNAIENGISTTYTKIIAQPGNEGKVYRFRIAA